MAVRSDKQKGGVAYLAIYRSVIDITAITVITVITMENTIQFCRSTATPFL